MLTRMQQRRGTAAQWSAANPVLADGEVGVEKDTRVFKIGDGVTPWNSLVSVVPDKYIDFVKDIDGGKMPAPLRALVLHRESTWPNRRHPYRLLWTDGDLMYGYATDGALRKSTNGGRTWVKTGYQDTAALSSAYGCFLRLASGTLLWITSSGGATVWRSTDDGATATAVFVMPANKIPLGSQTWCVDDVTGDVWLGEYNSTFTPEGISLWRGTADGATWTDFYTWAAVGSAAEQLTAVNKVKHIHTVQWDHVLGSAVISMGDSTDLTGLWRVNAARTNVEAMVLNKQMPPQWIDASRSIGIMPFPDYLCWAGDTTSQPYVFRILRSKISPTATYTVGDIGSGADIERIPYRLNSAAWWTTRASSDGARWLICATDEGGELALDRLTHVYAVEDQGETIWEVGAIKGLSTSAANSLMPVGQGEKHGDVVHMNTRLFIPALSFRFRLGRGLTTIEPPEPMPEALVQITVNSQEYRLAAGDEIRFARLIVPSTNRVFYHFQSGAPRTSAGGVMKVQARRVTDGSVVAGIDHSHASYQQNRHVEGGAAATSQTMTSAELIDIYLMNASVSTETTGSAFVTYGFGEA